MRDSEPAAPELAAGREALARGEWEAARECFQRAGAASGGAEAFDGLASACSVMADGNGAIAARERAFALYRPPRPRVPPARCSRTAPGPDRRRYFPSRQMNPQPPPSSLTASSRSLRPFLSGR